ncbi:MAG: proton-conducting transporter membrane subunit [Bacillota bacterium]|nr:proton-conducting transporter membrane subunit [Bacillota bacterium]
MNSIPLISIIIPLVFALIQLLINNKNIQKMLTFSGVLFSFICNLLLIKQVIYENKTIVFWFSNITPINKWVFGQGLEVDAFSLIFAIIISFIFLINSIYLFNNENNCCNKNIFILNLFLMSSILGILFSSDLFSIYFLIEIMSLIISILSAISSNSKKAYLNSLKLLLSNAVSSVFILLGTILLYIQIHTLNIAQISALLFSNYKEISLYAFVMLFVGYAIKGFILLCSVSNVEDINKSSISMSVLVSSACIVSGFYTLIRLVHFMFAAKELWNIGKMIIIAGVVVMLISLLIAIIQKKLIRSIIFILISQMGSMLITVGLGLSNNNVTAITAVNAFLHSILAYVIFTLLLLYSSSFVISTAQTDEIDKMGNLIDKMPITFITFLVGTFSIVGIPFFSGFNSKWSIIKVINDAGCSILFNIYLIYSIIIVVYFSVLLVKIFFRKNSDIGRNIKEVPFQVYLPALIVSIIDIIIGSLPQIITNDFVNKALYSIYNLQGYIDSVLGSGYVDEMFKTEYKMPKLTYNFNSLSSILFWNIYIFIPAFIILLIIYRKYVKNNIISKLNKVSLINKVNLFIKKFKINKRDGVYNDTSIFKKALSKASNIKLFNRIHIKLRTVYNLFVYDGLSINSSIICLLLSVSLMLIYTFYTSL